MKIRLLLLFNLLFVTTHFAMCQSAAKNSVAVEKAWEQYDKYREPAIVNRFMKHSEMLPLIEKHVASKFLTKEEIGKSVRGRSINHLMAGRGKTTVMLWSQMHGDESTATMALFDIFNFLSSDDDNSELRNLILDNLELHFVPMLNPDGAQAWRRRNELEIDINRDARMLVTPEGNALMSLAKKLKPQIGFNLHDQNYLYSAGRSGKSATISFLAPAYNYAKDMNDVRRRATQIILSMNKALQIKSPGNVAKYNDDFDPRCFGDTFQGMGISTILIESGGYYHDPEKQYIRKLNFLALLTAFESIAKQSYEQENIKDYEAIPENENALYDVFVKNVLITKEGREFKTHLGVNRSQIRGPENASMSYSGRIAELGDQELIFGYDEIDAEGLKFTPGKIKSMTRAEWDRLNPQQELDLMKAGYLFVKWSDGKSPAGAIKGRLLNLTSSNQSPVQTAGVGQSAQFLLTRDEKPVYAVVNGYKVDLSRPAKVLVNTMGY
ncbi:MAG: M14 family zinc carboxypeptidase [Daejeonella sp.]|uniref:M14 family zinc carboxypeptidase n=1 Tax=Daejeonella sp. JGW-45 TaxID=3034148 RepID=UPI0023EC9A23|nr:M14 family zinc carboxypeptidase [Daejeonella sp. JGW-45]